MIARGLRSTGLLSFSFLALMMLLVSGSSLAQAQSLRAGLPIDSATPRGMHRVAVDVPVAEGAPVHLSFATVGQSAPEITIDVLVASNLDRARRAAEWLHRTTSGELPTLGGVGDEGWGDAGMVAFIRDNILIVVRRTSGTHDVLRIARQLDSAVRRAPTGAPTASAITVTVTEPQPGQSSPVLIGSDWHGVYLSSQGDAAVRRSRSGWVLSRTGSGPYQLRAVGCDAMLRRSTN